MPELNFLHEIPFERVEQGLFCLLIKLNSVYGGRLSGIFVKMSMDKVLRAIPIHSVPEEVLG